MLVGHGKNNLHPMISEWQLKKYNVLFEVRESNIPNAGEGLFALVSTPKGSLATTRVPKQFFLEGTIRKINQNNKNLIIGKDSFQLSKEKGIFLVPLENSMWSKMNEWIWTKNLPLEEDSKNQFRFLGANQTKTGLVRLAQYLVEGEEVYCRYNFEVGREEWVVVKNQLALDLLEALVLCGPEQNIGGAESIEQLSNYIKRNMQTSLAIKIVNKLNKCLDERAGLLAQNIHNIVNGTKPKVLKQD